MIWIIILISLAILFYLYKTSRNDFFFQSPEDLKKAKQIMVLQLRNLERNEKDVKRFCIAYDWFSKNPERYDGSTIVRDLFDLKYNGFRLSTSSMWHDYDYIVNGANRNFVKNAKSNWEYFNDLLKNGKGAHIERLIGLTIVSIGFVPIMWVKYNLK